MKTAIFAAVLLCGLAARAEMPYHPIRSFDGTNCFLQPLYDWLTQRQADVRAGRTVRQVPRPLDEWLPTGTRDDGALWANFSVSRILPGSVLIVGAVDPQGGILPPRMSYIALTNYPGASAVGNGQQVSFIAIRNGDLFYKDDHGTNQHFALYDYGKIPLSPTNSPAKTGPDAAHTAN